MNASYEIRQGDAIDLLCELESDSIDAIVMDPPYSSGGFSETAKRQSRGQGVCSERVGKVRYFEGDNMGTAGVIWLLRSLAFEALPRLRPGGSLLVFTDWRQVANVGPAIESSGLRWSNLIVWDKGSFAFGAGFRSRHELCLQFTRGSGEYFATDVGNVITERRVVPRDREHFAQKPVPLLRELVRVVAGDGGLVVDPFCGSGSTGVAALLEGRRFLGFERDLEYCNVARERCRKASGDMAASPRADQLGLFGGTT